MKHGSLINSITASAASELAVGDGVTHLQWSDRTPYTVIAVSASGKTATIQMDRWTRVDSNGMSDAQEYAITPDPDGATRTIRLGKKGWGSKGERFALGRSRYHDFTF